MRNSQNNAIVQTVYILTVSFSQILLHHNEAEQEVYVDLWFQIIYVGFFQFIILPNERYELKSLEYNIVKRLKSQYGITAIL